MTPVQAHSTRQGRPGSPQSLPRVIASGSHMDNISYSSFFLRSEGNQRSGQANFLCNQDPFPDYNWPQTPWAQGVRPQSGPVHPPGLANSQYKCIDLSRKPGCIDPLHPKFSIIAGHNCCKTRIRSTSTTVDQLTVCGLSNQHWDEHTVRLGRGGLLSLRGRCRILKVSADAMGNRAARRFINRTGRRLVLLELPILLMFSMPALDRRGIDLEWPPVEHLPRSDDSVN